MIVELIPYEVLFRIFFGFFIMGFGFFFLYAFSAIETDEPMRYFGFKEVMEYVKSE
ncbi:MAG: hypothetical protein ACFFDT_07345 [Candidatus Hodarchaeota archaeon]